MRPVLTLPTPAPPHRLHDMSDDDFFVEDEDPAEVHAAFMAGKKGLTAPPVYEYRTEDGLCRLISQHVVGVPTFAGRPMIRVT